MTNKQFSRGLSYTSFHQIRRMFEIKNPKESERLLNELLSAVSLSISRSSFKYRIFKSRMRFEEYVKRNSLRKEVLFKEGIFKK